MVERNLAKVDVVGSNPIIRSQYQKQSIFEWAVFLLTNKAQPLKQGGNKEGAAPN